DVPSTHPFYAYIETGVKQGIISGYACGSVPDEPCNASHDPYFRPSAAITRGQIAKVITLAWGLPQPAPNPPSFADVPADHPFFAYIEAMTANGIVSGYACG